MIKQCSFCAGEATHWFADLLDRKTHIRACFPCIEASLRDGFCPKGVAIRKYTENRAHAEELLTLYAVRNGRGQWLSMRPVAYSFYCSPWELSLARARVFRTTKSACDMITRLTRSDPDDGPYSLIALHVAMTDDNHRESQSDHPRV